MKTLYFGCIGEYGHYIYDKEKNTRTLKHPLIPWARIDGRLCPEETRKQGVAKLHHKDGWTALAFWDSSVDKRPGSNSAFLAEGTYGFDEMIQVAKREYPSIIERLDYPIIQL